jgi:hypothetical protein
MQKPGVQHEPTIIVNSDIDLIHVQEGPKVWVRSSLKTMDLSGLLHGEDALESYRCSDMSISRCLNVAQVMGRGTARKQRFGPVREWWDHTND